MQSQRQNHTSRMFVFSAVYEIGLSSMCACQQNLGIHEDKFKKNLRKIIICYICKYRYGYLV